MDQSVSVITITYNQEDQLERLANSLALQTSKVHQWIIYDDGSDAFDIAAFVEKWGGTLPITPLLAKHEGKHPSKHFNQCLAQATGDIVFKVFGDTFLDIEAINQIQLTTDPGCAGCAYRYHFNPFALDWRFPYDPPHDRPYPVTGENPFMQMRGNGMIAWREDLVKLGGFDERFKGYGRDDYDMFMRLWDANTQLFFYNNVVMHHKFHAEDPDSQDNINLFNVKFSQVMTKRNPTPIQITKT
jgi:GT2 family glycosyltransferase